MADRYHAAMITAATINGYARKAGDERFVPQDFMPEDDE
jgi:hypothetical protein